VIDSASNIWTIGGIGYAGAVSGTVVDVVAVNLIWPPCRTSWRRVEIQLKDVAVHLVRARPCTSSVLIQSSACRMAGSSVAQATCGCNYGTQLVAVCAVLQPELVLTSVAGALEQSWIPPKYRGGDRFFRSDLVDDGLV
jgi:hypothetical protein